VILEDFAKAYSDYFKAALDGNWAEAQSGRFEFPEENPEVFGCYVDFFYTKKLRIDMTRTEDMELFLVESFLLDERRGSAEYRNAVMDALKCIWSEGLGPSIGTILLAFNESMERSKLRRFIVDKCAWDGKAGDVVSEDTLTEGIVPGFCLGLSIALMKQHRNAGPIPLSYRCTSRGGHGSYEHQCACGNDFRSLMHITNHSCGYCNDGGRGGDSGVPTCYSCHLRMDHWLDGGKRKSIAQVSQAPYNKNFCAEYHEHVDGISCEDSKYLKDSDQFELR